MSAAAAETLQYVASAILLKLRGSQQGSGRVAFFGYVTAVEHNGKCKIRGRRSTFEGSKSLMVGGDIIFEAGSCSGRRAIFGHTLNPESLKGVGG